MIEIVTKRDKGREIASRGDVVGKGQPSAISRRDCLRWLVATPAALSIAGCDDATRTGKLLSVWGRAGTFDGGLNKPRAMTIDANDEIYIVDITARIQVFKTDGTFLRGWQTPIHVNGRPTGMSIDRQGNLRVADTHYYRILTYSPQGDLIHTFGGTQGNGPGEFGFVTDVTEDSAGNFYVSEYGEFDRIQKFSPDGTFLLEWGGHGTAEGLFARPQALACDGQDRIWVADACNHRIQVFNPEGKLLQMWGTQGDQSGQLSYPYSFTFASNGDLYISEFGNHRVQRLSAEGQARGMFGTYGRKPGELQNPWAVVRDRQGLLYVLDTGNHRVQCVEL